MKVEIRHAVPTGIAIPSGSGISGRGIMDIITVGEELCIIMTWPGRAVMYLDHEAVYLDRDAVKALLPHLAAWVETGKLEVP